MVSLYRLNDPQFALRFRGSRKKVCSIKNYRPKVAYQGNRLLDCMRLRKALFCKLTTTLCIIHNRLLVAPKHVASLPHHTSQTKRFMQFNLALGSTQGSAESMRLAKPGPSSRWSNRRIGYIIASHVTSILCRARVVTVVWIATTPRDRQQFSHAFGGGRPQIYLAQACSRMTSTLVPPALPSLS